LLPPSTPLTPAPSCFTYTTLFRSRQADIVAIATGCGMANCHWAADEEDFERLVDLALAATGPVLIAARIDDKPGVGATRRDPARSEEHTSELQSHLNQV